VADTWTYQPPPGDPVVLHHDRDTIVVDKPSGLLSVPGRGDHQHDSALSRVTALFGTAYAVHRLDLDTSGILVFATRRKAERDLFRQFRERTVAKTYLARVHGVLDVDEGVIDLPLKRVQGAPRSEVCHTHGRPARTRFVVHSRAPGSTLVWLHPQTGRSHQLRVHLLALGHPILGDRFYAPRPVVAAAPRLMLHATELAFDHPFSGERLHIRAPAPFLDPIPLPEVRP